VEYNGVGITDYPWQATWADGSVAATATTTDTLAGDGQAVTHWRDLITELDATAAGNNIALYETGDLPTHSLKFDNTDYFAIPTTLRTVFNSQNYGYIFAGARDTAPTAGDPIAHGIVSINRTNASPKIGLVSRFNKSSNFAASTAPNTGDTIIYTATGASNSNYNVLTNESKWLDGNINLRVNGNLISSGSFDPSIPNDTTASSYIGAYTGVSTTNFNGYMTAIILAADSNPLYDTDRNRIERFIGLLGAVDIPLV
jgi:hypothetical protein